LQSLSCSNCQLTYLDISNDSNLQTVCCPNNQLSTDALDDLFGLLPFEKQINKALYAILQRNPGMVLNYNSDHTWNKKTLYVSVRGNPGAESCDRIIAQNKGWIIK
jgi:Leucine-rich repeat (LRR) protein